MKQEWDSVLVAGSRLSRVCWFVVVGTWGRGILYSWKLDRMWRRLVVGFAVVVSEVVSLSCLL